MFSIYWNLYGLYGHRVFSNNLYYELGLTEMDLFIFSCWCRVCVCTLTDKCACRTYEYGNQMRIWRPTHILKAGEAKAARPFSFDAKTCNRSSFLFFHCVINASHIHRNIHDHQKCVHCAINNEMNFRKAIKWKKYINHTGKTNKQMSLGQKKKEALFYERKKTYKST